MQENNLTKPQLTPSKADVQHALCQSVKWLNGRFPRAGDMVHSEYALCVMVCFDTQLTDKVCCLLQGYGGEK